MAAAASSGVIAEVSEVVGLRRHLVSAHQSAAKRRVVEPPSPQLLADEQMTVAPSPLDNPNVALVS